MNINPFKSIFVGNGQDNTMITTPQVTYRRDGKALLLSCPLCLMLALFITTLLTAKVFAADNNKTSLNNPLIQHGLGGKLVLPVSANTHNQGATATLLPSGDWLVLGGIDSKSQTSMTETRVYNPVSHKVTKLASGLSQPHSYHTATLLPNGKVLVLGGMGNGGKMVAEAELLDPQAGTTTVLANLRFPVRAKHRATLLVDGHVLVSGGIDVNGVALTDLLLIDPRTGIVETLSATLDAARLNHLSTLVPRHDVLIWGGTGTDGAALGQAELYTPGDSVLHAQDAAASAKLLADIDSPSPPLMIDSEPADGTTAVELDKILSVRFSKPLKVTSLNDKSVTLIGPDGQTPALVTPTEGGLVVFVTPKHELAPGADYTLFIEGAVDGQGQALAMASVGFKTRSLAAASTKPGANGAGQASNIAQNSQTNAQQPANILSQLLDRLTGKPQTQPETNAKAVAVVKPIASKAANDIDNGESWEPGDIQRHGHWRTGKKLPDAVVSLLDFDKPIRHRIKAQREKLSPGHRGKREKAFAKESPNHNKTGIGGTVMRLNDKPLEEVTITVNGKTTQSDKSGRFELTDIAPGHYEMVIDGRTAKHEYLYLVLGVDIDKGELTELPHAVYLPRVRKSDWVEFNAPTDIDTVIKYPDMPGLEIQIPKGTVFRDHGGKVINRLAIVPVPLDRAPYPTPGDFPVYFHLHPGGVKVETGDAQGIRVVYPNATGAAPGSQHDLWVYNPVTGQWDIYGRATVSADGSQVIPDPSVVLKQTMGISYTINSSNVLGPQPPIPPDGCPPSPKDGAPSASGPSAYRADPVHCPTGVFLHNRTDVSIDDVIPIEIGRTYRTGDVTVREFGIGANHMYAMYLRSPVMPWLVSSDLYELILPNGNAIAFNRVSGTGYYDSVWVHSSSPSRFQGAKLTFTSAPYTSHITLRDGTEYHFSNGGYYLTGMNDRYGNKVNITRSGAKIQRLTTHHGRYVDFSYDALSRVTAITDYMGRVWNYEYYPTGHASAQYLKKVTYPDTTFEEYAYDSAGRMLTVKDRRGNLITTNEYDATSGRITKQTLADGAVFQFGYTVDAGGKITQTDVTNPRGHVERLQYNAAGYITGQTLALGRPEQQVRTYTRTAANYIDTGTDALGRVTKYEYDAKGNQTKVTKLFGTANAVSTIYTYEPVFNQVKSVINPESHVTTLTYDALGNVTRVQDHLGNKVDMAYDTVGRTVTSKSYNGATALTTTYGYDGPDLVSVTDPLSRKTEYFPDALGRIVTVKDALSRFTRTDYDLLDRVLKVTDPQGKFESFSYDGNGNQKSFTDAKGQVTNFTYDSRDRLVTKQDALLRTESYAYDVSNNLIFATDRKNQVTGHVYDALGRRIQVGYGATSTTAPTFTSTITYTYDAASRLTQAVDSINGDITRSYDDRFDKVSRETTPQGTLDYTYYADGQRQSMTPSGGSTVTYTYDAANRLTQIAQAAGLTATQPATAQSVGMVYDTANRPTKVTLPNGMTMDYGYDNASQLTAITYKKADTTVQGNLTYTYNAQGQRISTGGTFARTGLPTAVASTAHNANNQLTTKDAVAHTYDNNGNLTNDGSRTYTWNVRNQLVGISGADTATFTYDAFGRRRSATVNGVSTSTLYDGWNPIQLQSGGVAVENRLYGLGLDSVYNRTRGGVTESFLSDALGSTLELRNAAQIQTVQYTYDPYGGTAASVASSNTIKYTGREQDASDLYYYRNRYFKPSTGRFVSEDPIGLAGGSNLYTYVSGNPVNYNDPLGLHPYGRGKPVIGEIIDWILPIQDPINTDPYNNQIPGDNTGGDDGGSENELPRAPQPGERAKSDDDALEKLSDMERAQKAVREGKSDKRIDSIEKSKQRAKHHLRCIDIDDLDCGCD